MAANRRNSDLNPAWLRCPKCGQRLALSHSHLRCTSRRCRSSYPIVDGVPVLIDDDRSVFSIGQFVDHEVTTTKEQGWVKQFASKVLPSLGVNLVGERNYGILEKMLMEKTKSPRVLVIGSGAGGAGMGGILANRAIDFIHTDVSFGSRTRFLCDAHDLPFADRTFDAVIAQAVLEHVVDPFRCVEEIHRVLRGDGLVYAETPFMQQVHGGRYDFMRFTHLGHRRLFRKFSEVSSGAACGPGMALAWAYQYFLLSFVKTKCLRVLVVAFSSVTSFWLKYFDYILIDRPGTLDAASGYYFLGRKSGDAIVDRELLALYGGLF